MSGGASENFGEQAVVLWVEVLHKDDSQAGIGRQLGQQMLENFEAAGGPADSDHWDGCGAFGRGWFRGIVRRRLIHHQDPGYHPKTQRGGPCNQAGGKRSLGTTPERVYWENRFKARV